MMIPVVLKDGTDARVFPQVLDHLLESRQVFTFKRSEGWVVVGRDPVRAGAKTGFEGDDRRHRVPMRLV